MHGDAYYTAILQSDPRVQVYVSVHTFSSEISSCNLVVLYCSSDAYVHRLQVYA